MKIAFLPIKRNSPTGGSEQLWAYTALEACRCKQHVHIYPYKFNNPHPKLQELQSMGAKISYRPIRNLSIPILLRAFRKLTAWINYKLNRVDKSLRSLLVNDFDLLVVSQGSWYDLADDQELIRAITKYNLPFVIICHSFQDIGLLSSNRKESILSVFKSAKSVYFVSKRQKEVVEKYLGYQIKNFQIVLNPLNINSFEILPQPQLPLTLVMISSLVTKWKGHDLLLEALSTSKWKERSWKLLIYGKGEDEEEIEHLIQFYNLNDKVELKGYCENPELALVKGHILVVPSRVEAAPLIVYEAFLKGRPVLGTDIGDIGDVIQDGKNGFLSEAPHPKYLDKALERLWINRHSLNELGEAAFNSVESRFKSIPEQYFLKCIIEDAQN